MSADTLTADPWTVLLVDDEPNIVQSLRRLFRGTGYRVLTAPSGADALATLERERVDLVMSDMRMPSMDGAQLLEQVRTRWPAATRVLLTGYADVASSSAALDRGAVHRRLSKPWDDDEVLACAREAFAQQAASRTADTGAGPAAETAL